MPRLGEWNLGLAIGGVCHGSFRRNLCDTTFTRSITMKPDDHARRDVGEEEGGHDDDDTLARGSVVGSVYRVNDEICTQTQYKAELLK